MITSGASQETHRVKQPEAGHGRGNPDALWLANRLRRRGAPTPASTRASTVSIGKGAVMSLVGALFGLNVMTDLSPQLVPKRKRFDVPRRALWRSRIVLAGTGVGSLTQLGAAKVSKSNFRSKRQKFCRHFKGVFWNGNMEVRILPGQPGSHSTGDSSAINLRYARHGGFLQIQARSLVSRFAQSQVEIADSLC
jgi:hypothetical protein